MYCRGIHVGPLHHVEEIHAEMKKGGNWKDPFTAVVVLAGLLLLHFNRPEQLSRCLISIG